jgi:hypothetical protein
MSTFYKVAGQGASRASAMGLCQGSPPVSTHPTATWLLGSFQMRIKRTG